MQQISDKTAGESIAARPRKWATGVWNSAATSYQLVLTSALALAILGLIMVLSSSAVDSLQLGKSAYAVFSRQFIFGLVGGVLMLVASRIPVSIYHRFAPWLMLFGLALQALIFTPLAKNVKGNRNWIELGPVQFQPSEFLKLAFCVFLGTIIVRKLRSSTGWGHVLIPVLGAAGLSIALVMAGDDLGTALIFFLILAGALIIAGIPWPLFGMGMLFAGAAVGAMAIFKSNRLDRIFATYNPECETSGLCYQVTRGLAGLGSGGLGGVGLGAGREKWSYLPEAHNDFIFAVLGEELGFLGTMSVLILFILLGLGIVRIINRHPDPMVKISAAAIGAWLMGQAAINIGVVTKILPVIGVPLPLVSGGGSALVASLLAVGVLLAFARDEPGAKQAFAARSSVVRKTFAIVSGSRRTKRPGSATRE